MLYILTESEIRRLFARKMKPSEAMQFTNWALIAYTGAYIESQTGRRCKADVFDAIGEGACMHASLGDYLADEISSRIVEDKFEDPDR